MESLSFSSVPEANAEITEGAVVPGGATGESELPEAEAITPKESEVAAAEKTDEEAALKRDSTEERGDHAPPPKRNSGKDSVIDGQGRRGLCPYWAGSESRSTTHGCSKAPV